jgi:hypothetical protein
MKTELWLKSNTTGEWISVDIFEDLVISVNKTFEEIADFTTRLSTFTKTFTIPRTAKNDQFFEEAYEVNSSSFVNNVVVGAVVKYGGADVFFGDCRLERIIIDPNEPAYEIFLTQSLPDFVNTIQDIKLIDIDYSELSHTLSYDNVVSTWTYTGGSYANYTGLTGSILYPLANYGYDDSQYFGVFEDSISGFTSSSTPLTLFQFAPWVNIKYMVDKVFQRAGFTYTSDFFDTPYFEGIFALAKTNNQMGVFVSSGASDNANVFLAQSRGSSSSGAFEDINFTNLNQDYEEFFFLGVENTDPLNIFTTSISTTNREHFFTTAVSGTYKLRVRFSAFVRTSSFPVYLNVGLVDLDDNTIYADVQGILIQGTTNLTTIDSLYFSVSLPAGRRIGLKYARQTGIGSVAPQPLGIYECLLELFQSPVLAGTEEVLLQTNLPSEITCLDFIRGLVNMFNLVVIPQGDRNLLIERWDTYFNEGDVVDWSSKIDVGSQYSLAPTNELQREYILRYENSTDRFSLINQQDRNQQFGTFRYFSNVPYHSGTIEMIVPFQPLPIATFDVDSESNMLIPHLYTWNRGAQTLGNQFNPLGSDLRLGWYNGMLDFTITGTTKTWYLLSGATSVGHTTYPAISHLSSYEYIQSTFSDLNFGNQYDYWQIPNDTYVGFTNRDIYNDFWAARIQPLYDPDVKILRGLMKLTPTEINNIQFNDRVYFLNAYWRLLNIIDGDITNTSMVETEWIKLPYTLVPQGLIPPTYEQSFEPIIPTPTGSTFVIAVFISNNITDLCAENGLQTGVFSNCSTLSAGCSVFSDSGATTPLDEGTLLKVSGDPNIYQVIEQGIIVVFTQC